MKPKKEYIIYFFYPNESTIDDYEIIEGTEKQAIKTIDIYRKEYDYPLIKLFKATTTYEEIK